MRAWLAGLPLIVLVLGIGAVSMLPISVHAYIVRDLYTGRVFFYGALFFLILVSMLAVATSSYRIRRQGRSHLISLLATFTILPAMLAVPFSEAIRDTAFINAYLEMVSSLTTTGAAQFPSDRLPSSLHLWRAQVGWMGGFFVWVTAIAILAPMNLGGYEVGSEAEIGQGAVGATQITRVADPSQRIMRFAVLLAPVYIGLTLVLWILLLLAGDTPLVALCHAMSTLATSGISPIDGTAGAGSQGAGEFWIFLFFVFALSRLTYSSWERRDGWISVWQDAELRLGLAIVAVVPVLLFLRHWAGEFGVEVTLSEGITGIWGGLFTAMSFLTTTGFVSVGWDEAQNWSGLTSPGLILMGLSVFGGGIATTAGGVKLFRVFALYKHGLREMEKLVQPSSVGGSGQVARRIRRQGAYSAWVFFMLFAMSIAVVMLAFALSGIDFEEGLVLTIAALSTTGPLTQVALADPIVLLQLTPVAKLVFAGAMVIGRLEILAIIALMNPSFWR
jgi:trk system potassium uptake protein TrkH